MSETTLHELTQPSEIELAEAIAKFGTNATPQELMDAALVIVGEACVQLGDQGKTQDEVVAFLAARGLTPEATQTLVDKAMQIVVASMRNHTMRAADKRALTWELILFGVVAIAVAMYFLR